MKKLILIMLLSLASVCFAASNAPSNSSVTNPVYAMANGAHVKVIPAYYHYYDCYRHCWINRWGHRRCERRCD